jgi:uncharacterized protein with NRDE domain
MCIALISTEHPSYSLILIDNRDEYLNRPTAPASWWPEPHEYVLGGRDLLRSIQGTWLGVTRSGRIAVLTNFREDGPAFQGAVSRGAIIRAFLTGEHPSTEKFVKEMLTSGVSREAGGFSLVCGNIGEPLAVMSNRASSEADIPWIRPDTARTVGLSNAAFGDQGWKKVDDGEKKLKEVIRNSAVSGESEDDFIQRLLKLLSTDTLPRIDGNGGLETYINQLRNSIFVPAIGHRTDLHADEIAAAGTREKASVVREGIQEPGVSGLYGTAKQTVVLCSHSGKVRFFERTLYDDNSMPIPAGNGDLDFDFELRGEGRPS